jgi:predicted transcriptional regulator
MKAPRKWLILSLVAEIVRSYVAQNSIGVDQVAGLIATVHRSLSGLVQGAPTPALLVPAVPIRRSVQHDHIVCFECGFLSQMLRRHTHSVHGLEPAGCRIRWKLPADHPITAPAYSERRSTMAKRIGLGRKPQEAVVSTPEAVAAPQSGVAANRDRQPRSSLRAAARSEHRKPSGSPSVLYPIRERVPCAGDHSGCRRHRSA